MFYHTCDEGKANFFLDMDQQMILRNQFGEYLWVEKVR